MKRSLESLECGGCGYNGRWLLHNLRHRRLCTNCVLKSHPGYFCSICLNVFETNSSSPPPPSLPSHQARLTCVKCPSVCHLSCTSSSSSSSFLCPPCSNPNLTFFQVNVDDKNVMDDFSAKALVAAAKIAAFSMIKAATVARMEAERRVKEAALAKKRAREALEMLLYLAADEKDNQSLKKVKPRVSASNHLSRGGHGTQNSH